MKKFLLTMIAASSLAISGYAQCLQSSQLELKMQKTDAYTYEVSIRFHNANSAAALLPNTETKLDGLVFAIASTSNNKSFVKSISNVLPPFTMVIDEQSAVNTNKKNTDNIVTFYHDNTSSLPLPFQKNWMANQWYPLMQIKVNAKETESCTLLNCDYGIANPNSYAGNSSTDPWIALLNNNEYLQYTPKIVVVDEEGNKNSLSIFPNPVTTQLHLNINSNANTSCVAKIIAENGQVVKLSYFDLQSGENSNLISVEELPIGNYSIVVVDGKNINLNTLFQKR
jgi:hypothetical protein